MKNKLQPFYSYFQLDITQQNRILLSCFILLFLLVNVKSSDIQSNSIIKSYLNKQQIILTNSINNQSKYIQNIESSRKLNSESVQYITDSDLDNYIVYDDRQTNQLDIDQEYKFNQNVQNGTFYLSNYRQYKYIHVQFYLDNEESINNYSKLNSIRLHANLDIPAQYNQQKQIVSQFFDSNGFVQKKSSLYLLINQEQFNDSKKIYLTLIFDQPSNQKSISYKYRLKISGHNNSKPCPNGCSSINGKCINGKCKCQQQYIDEDCSKNAYQVEINSLQTKLLFKETTIQYIYINVNEELINYQLKATVTTNESKLPTCIIYQQEKSNCEGDYCTQIPTLIDKKPKFCIKQNSLQDSSEFFLNESPVTFQKGQQIIIGVQQQVSFFDVSVYIKLELTEYTSTSHSDSDDIATIISIACSFFITFAMFFICYQYCKNRNQQQNSTEEGQLQSITENSVQIDIKKQLIITKKLDKKLLDKYLPAQMWEDAKQILLNQNREITDPFNCLLCHCNIEKDEKVRMSMCFHVLHEDCFDQWFISKECCPMCRRDHKLSDLEEYQKNKSELNQSDNYLCEMAMQFDQITKKINQSSPKQTQTSINQPKFIKKKPFIQQISVNFLQNQQSSDTIIQMQEIKINPEQQSQKQLSQSSQTHGSIYYQNNPIRKSSTNSDKNNQGDQEIKATELIKNSFQVYQQQQQNSQLGAQINNTEMVSSISLNSILSSPISSQQNQLGRLQQRNRFNSSSSESSPHSAGLKYKRGQNTFQMSSATLFNNKIQKTVFIKEVESEDEENPKENKIQEKNEQLITNNMTLNYIKDIESIDDIKQNQISSQNVDHLKTDNNITKSNKFSLASIGSDFSMFSPINFRKYRESSAKVFESDGSLNLDLVDSKNEQIQNTYIKLRKQSSNQYTQGDNVSTQSYSNLQQDYKFQQLTNKENKLNIQNDYNMFYKQEISQQSELNNQNQIPTQIKYLLPQDQL